MWQRELEILREQLLDVWSADIICLLNLNDLEDLNHVSSVSHDLPLSRDNLRGSS